MTDEKKEFDYQSFKLGYEFKNMENFMSESLFKKEEKSNYTGLIFLIVFFILGFIFGVSVVI